MKNGKRDYKREDLWDKNHKGRAEDREARHKARAAAIAHGVIKKGSDKQIDHKKPLSKGGSNSMSNLRAVSGSTNMSFRRNAKGGLVSQTSKRERSSSKKGR
jgi:5-methylcytosine-specific restriction endonuclease McrA